MADIKGYKPGTGDALDSTPDLKARQKAAQVDPETGQMADLIDTDHHEIGTKAVPDLPMPDPHAAWQTYPTKGRQPKSEDWEFADLLTVPSGPPPQELHIPEDHNQIFVIMLVKILTVVSTLRLKLLRMQVLTRLIFIL